MQATEHMAIPSASMKRRLSNEYTEQTSKRPAMFERPEYALHPQYPSYQPSPHPAGSHVNILPRPLNGDHREPRSPAPRSDVPKKRGRPSRADKAKRDLHPLLPRPSLDQTSPVLHSPYPVASPGSQNSFVALAPKTDRLPSIVPGPRPSSATRLTTPPRAPTTPPEAPKTSPGAPRTPPEAYIAMSKSSAGARAPRASASPRAAPGGTGPYQPSQPRVGVSSSRVKQVLAE